MSDAPDKVAALLDAVRVLDALGAAYALIGGVAVGIHSGVPRATLDTNLAVMSTQDRTAVVGALRASGFDLIGEHAHTASISVTAVVSRSSLRSTPHSTRRSYALKCSTSAASEYELCARQISSR